MIICKTLNISPEWLLSGIEEDGRRSNVCDYYVISKESDVGELVSAFSDMDIKQRERVMGYVRALVEIL